jgi:hypothetical protein
LGIGNGYFRSQFRIMLDERDVGFEAFSMAMLRDVLQEKRSDGFAFDVLLGGGMQGLGDIPFHFWCRYFVLFRYRIGDEYRSFQP